MCLCEDVCVRGYACVGVCCAHVYVDCVCVLCCAVRDLCACSRGREREQVGVYAGRSGGRVRFRGHESGRAAVCVCVLCVLPWVGEGVHLFVCV